MKRAPLILALLAACNTLPPELLPPPFGPTPEKAGTTHLFFSTGMAVTPDGALVIANANTNREYDFGTVVSLSPDFVTSFFDGRRSCPNDADPVCAIPADAPAVIVGNYSGDLVLNDAGDTAYMGSRDTGLLNAVAVGPGGALSCPPGTGTSATDCRNGLVNLGTAFIQGTATPARVDGPSRIVRGDYLPMGSTTLRDVFYVSSVVPHIDAIQSGILTTSSWVAALDVADPTQVLFSLKVSNSLDSGNGWAPGPMAFDSARRRLYLMGCYSRFAGTGAGEPGTAKCNNNSSNLLRVIDVDAQGAADTQFYEMYADVLSIETTQLLLADPDPSTGVSTTLYATMRNPDTLVRIGLPLSYSQPPRVRQVIAMPITPADMVRIPRPGLPDLIAVASEKSGSVAIYEVGKAVVGIVEGLGDAPFTMERIPCPPSAAGSACLAVSVFGDCRIAFIQVPLDKPWTAQLRGRPGGCQQ